MKIKNIIQEDFTNFKTCSMFIGFPSCTWKCERECGMTGLCQNAALAKAPSIDIDTKELVRLYLANSLSSAVVCGGLEPFDSWTDLLDLVTELRQQTADPIVIYTGYNKSEIVEFVEILTKFQNIIIKFGRFVPNEQPRYDDVLGIKLASNNQYAERIS